MRDRLADLTRTSAPDWPDWPDWKMLRQESNAGRTVLLTVL